LFQSLANNAGWIRSPYCCCSCCCCYCWSSSSSHWYCCSVYCSSSCRWYRDCWANHCCCSGSQQHQYKKLPLCMW